MPWQQMCLQWCQGWASTEAAAVRLAGETRAPPSVDDGRLPILRWRNNSMQSEMSPSEPRDDIAGLWKMQSPRK